MGKARLTELAVAKLSPPATGRTEVFDAALPGFGVRVTSSGILRHESLWDVCMERRSGRRRARVAARGWPA
jgi:hypothetical protein